MGISDLEKVTLQIQEVYAEVDAPVRTAGTGSFDSRSVDRANAVAVRQRRRGVTLPKFVGHPAQPLFGGSKPLEQCDAGDVAPTCLLGDGGRFFEGTASSQVDQQDSQQD